MRTAPPRRPSTSRPPRLALGPRLGTHGSSQRGFTLIELMVALVVSSLLIGMILSIFTRMSMAYRAQQNVSELQQTLAAAQELIQREVRQAGFQIPDGFQLATAPAVTQQSLQVVNNADGFGPDLIRVFHADASAQARVMTPAGFAAGPFDRLTVDDADLFAVGDVVVMVAARPDGVATNIQPTSGAAWLHYRACVLQISDIAGNDFTLETAPPWGAAGNPQCNQTRTMMVDDPLIDGDEPKVRMLYRFSGRAFRIDPARRQLAVLQMSPTGGLIAGDWQDMGVGFTDLQIATRWNDYWNNPADDVDTADVDTDPILEWYSGEQQEALTTTLDANNEAALWFRSVVAEARVSVVVRTIKKMDAVPTAATPALVDAARPDNSDLGDRAAVTLAGVADAARPAELRGDAVFRHATIGADLRNMAVGQ